MKVWPLKVWPHGRENRRVECPLHPSAGRTAYATALPNSVAPTGPSKNQSADTRSYTPRAQESRPVDSRAQALEFLDRLPARWQPADTRPLAGAYLDCLAQRTELRLLP